jgi:thymidylate synthase (FAD)
MGSDISVVNSARVSYDSRTDCIREGKDDRLMKYLWDHQHTSPFRHATLQFHIKAPIFVLRQWMKHQVGCAWNERSGRYVKFKTDWWSPDHLSQENDQKQGAGCPLNDFLNIKAIETLQKGYADAYKAYNDLLEMGVAKEEARAVLPVGMFSECYWTASLQAVLHFLTLRLDEHTQNTTRSYARAVYELIQRHEQYECVLDIFADGLSEN